MGGAAEVEHDGRGLRAGLLVLTDDQLAGAGRGPPVHEAEVVAGDVLAQPAEQSRREAWTIWRFRTAVGCSLPPGGGVTRSTFG